MNTQTITPAVEWGALAGKRFGIYGFAAEESLAIRSALETTEAFCRILLPPADEDGWLSFDAMLTNIDDAATRERLEQRASARKPPLLLIGSAQSVAAAMPLLEKTGGEFLLAGEWSANELLLRMLRLTWKMEQPAASAASGKPAKVLLLDDDNSILSILNLVLTKAGFECHSARDGNSGFDMARELRPDLMIIDVNMPNRSGFEVLKLLSQSPETASIKTMMLSACEQEADILRGFGLGADDYVTKPFNPMEVAARVKSVLGRGK